MTWIQNKKAAAGRTRPANTCIHGVCKHFWGNSLTGWGECRKHRGLVKGSITARGCADWTRRIAGVDEVPFGKVPPISDPTL